MRSLLLAGLVFLGACKIENTVQVEPPPQALPNPPDEVNTRTSDRFVQIQEPKVDVLFVVDNSSSMGEEQTALAQNFPLMMEYFLESGLDFHIGMVATDVLQSQYRGKLRSYNGPDGLISYIDTDTTDPLVAFSAFAASLGTITGTPESGRAAAYQMLEINRNIPRNEGFYRDEAELHIIFVSDTYDNSNDLPADTRISQQEFMAWAANLKNPVDRTTMHAIVQVPTNLTNCVGWTRPGVDYISYANTTGGVVQSICEDDWGPALDSLGLQTTGLRQEFFLTRLPVITPMTIEVRVRFPATESQQEITLQFPVCLVGEEFEDEDCEVVYSPGRNSITFLDYVADPLAEVLIDYTRREDYSADGEIVQ